MLAACTFDLKFTYVLPRWEGIAFGPRILNNTLCRCDKLKVPRGNFVRKKKKNQPLVYNNIMMHVIPIGKYYLVDAGFMLRSTLVEYLKVLF